LPACVSSSKTFKPAICCICADFRTTKVGRYATHYLVKTLERFGVAPKGSLEVASMLERAADGLVAGGKMGLFTPLFFFLVRKPTNA
jgi:sterol 24-C-methyltransferase